MEIEVCYALPDRAHRTNVTLAAGATVADAIARSEFMTRISLDRGALGIAVFGRRATMQTVLVDGDRVELLRPLVVDPKEARRRRAARKRGLVTPAQEAPITCSTAPPAPAAC